MKSLMSCAPLLFLLLLIAGCGKSEQETALTEMVDCMNEMTEILKTVKDDTTAILAEPKLEKLGKRMEAASNRMARSFTRMDPQEMQSLLVDYQEEMTQSGQRFAAELLRVSCIPGTGEDIQKMLASMKASGST